MDGCSCSERVCLLEPDAYAVAFSAANGVIAYQQKELVASQEAKEGHYVPWLPKVLGGRERRDAGNGRKSKKEHGCDGETQVCRATMQSLDPVEQGS